MSISKDLCCNDAKGFDLYGSTVVFFVDDRIICIILFLRKNEVSQKSLNTRTVPMYAACNHNFCTVYTVP